MRARGISGSTPTGSRLTLRSSRSGLAPLRVSHRNPRLNDWQPPVKDRDEDDRRAPRGGKRRKNRG
jgi:hypothetical protein